MTMVCTHLTISYNQLKGASNNFHASVYEWQYITRFKYSTLRSPALYVAKNSNEYNQIFGSKVIPMGKNESVKMLDELLH